MSPGNLSPYWNLFSVLPGERTLPLLYRWGLWQHHYSFYQFYSGNVFSLSPITYLLPSDLVICHHGGGSSRVLRCTAQYTNQAQTSLPSPRLKSLVSFFFAHLTIRPSCLLRSFFTTTFSSLRASFNSVPEIRGICFFFSRKEK